MAIGAVINSTQTTADWNCGWRSRISLMRCSKLEGDWTIAYFRHTHTQETSSSNVRSGLGAICSLKPIYQISSHYKKRVNSTGYSIAFWNVRMRDYRENGFISIVKILLSGCKLRRPLAHITSADLEAWSCGLCNIIQGYLLDLPGSEAGIH